eukprot:GHVU01211777.1.p1 GENE.GHVU01211777.1~~GHVU01211777.1.p1  ORF type:complete len:192 (+),score=39.55 GHVU01211777.1:41-577(+)
MGENEEEEEEEEEDEEDNDYVEEEMRAREQCVRVNNGFRRRMGFAGPMMDGADLLLRIFASDAGHEGCGRTRTSFHRALTVTRALKAVKSGFDATAAARGGGGGIARASSNGGRSPTIVLSRPRSLQTDPTYDYYGNEAAPAPETRRLHTGLLCPSNIDTHLDRRTDRQIDKSDRSAF